MLAEELMKTLIISIFLISNLFGEYFFNSSIYNSNNEPIENVTISCNDNATISNKDGYFEIYCADNSISLSHVKYFPKTIYNKLDEEIILNEKFLEVDEYEIYGGLNSSNSSPNINIYNISSEKYNHQNHFEDIIYQKTNINYAGGTSRSKYFQIRGIGELSQFSGEGPPHFYVGYIVDDIDFSGIGLLGFLDDIRQIEVFKGPQSMIYGPNSMAGVINFISNNPIDKKEFNTSISFFSKNGLKFSSTLSIPINNFLSSRFTLAHNYTDGMVKNIFRNRYDTNSKDENMFRAKFTFKPSEEYKLNLTLYSLNLNNKYDVWTPDNNGFETYTDYQGYDKQKTYAISLNSSYVLNEGILTNIISISENDINYSYDGDWGHNEFWYNPPYNFDPSTQGYEWSFPDFTIRNRNTKSCEIRYEEKLIDITYTLGVYLSEVIEKDKRNGYLFAGFADSINSSFKIENFALYGQLIHRINEKSKLSYTLRNDINTISQNLDYSKYDWSTYGYVTNNFLGKVEDKKLLGGSIQFNTIIDKTTNLSISISRGYKTSGVNQTQSSYFQNYEDELRYYDTEFSNNLEFGLNFIKEKTNFKVSTFYLNRINPQLRLFYQFDITNPNSFDYATINAEKGYNYGIELEFDSILNDYINFYGSIGTLKTFISKFEFEGSTYGNRENAHAPKFNSNLGMVFNLSKFIYGLSFSIDSNYRSSFYFDDQNNHKSKPYSITNFKLNYKYNMIEFTIWGKNIFNKKYPIRGYTFALDPTYEVKDWKSYGDLKSYGFTVNYNFK